MSILTGFCGSHQFFMADILHILKEIKFTSHSHPSYEVVRYDQ